MSFGTNLSHDHECLWVLYLNIKNIAYILIQEPQKISEPQKTTEITHIFKKIAYAPPSSRFSPWMQNILLFPCMYLDLSSKIKSGLMVTY